MKQKYRIWKDDRQKTLLIQEFAVLSANAGKQKYSKIHDDDYSLLCEQTYTAGDIKRTTGKSDLILLLRNQHFFPIATYMNKIADVVMGMYAAKGELHKDLVFDDTGVDVDSPAEQETIAEITDATKKNPAKS